MLDIMNIRSVEFEMLDFLNTTHPQVLMFTPGQDITYEAAGGPGLLITTEGHLQFCDDITIQRGCFTHPGVVGVGGVVKIKMEIKLQGVKLWIRNETKELNTRYVTAPITCRNSLYIGGLPSIVKDSLEPFQVPAHQKKWGLIGRLGRMIINRYKEIYLMDYGTRGRGVYGLSTVIQPLSVERKEG